MVGSKTKGEIPRYEFFIFPKILFVVGNPPFVHRFFHIPHLAKAMKEGGTQAFQSNDFLICTKNIIQATHSNKSNAWSGLDIMVESIGTVTRETSWTGTPVDNILGSLFMYVDMYRDCS